MNTPYNAFDLLDPNFSSQFEDFLLNSKNNKKLKEEDYVYKNKIA